MKNNITELVFILDMSGSMSGLESDTIGGFNSVLNSHKNEEGKTYVTTYLFNSNSRMIHDRLPIEEVENMTDKQYIPGGSTALIDAMGNAIRHIAKIHRYGRKEDVPEHTIFVITTDGMENASHQFSAEEVRRMVSHEQEKYGWEFIFLGANIDAAETARRYGIEKERAVNYMHDSMGTSKVYDAVNKAIRYSKADIQMDDSDWRDDIDADFQSRSK